MRKIAVGVVLVFQLVGAFYVFNTDIWKTSMFNPAADVYDINMKRDLLSLMVAYPDFIKDVERDSKGNVYVVMKSGTRILYDDKKEKNHEQKLANPDLEDMMFQSYPLASIKSLMAENYDPGRGRVYALLKEVYGGSKAQVESNLVNVKVGGSYQFNRSNNAAESLKNVMKEVAVLTQKRSDIGAFVYPCSGTFNYRYISGTNRLSSHSFGIAIDLARDKRDYWQWATREQGQKRLQSYPIELVEVFEKNGFVWGGKWGHFDILHFEYRPEIILKARYFGSKDFSTTDWFSGAPVDEILVKTSIEKINNAIR